MTIKKKLISLVPSKYELPLRYHYKLITGSLEKEFTILASLIGKGEVAIDVGANYGYYSYALAKIANKVESFEPNPACARVISSYGAKNITVHNVGLSSKSGTLPLHVPIINGVTMTELASFGDYSGEQQMLTVPVRTLDEYQFTNVSFIKIDVEGHELDVITGAEKTILRDMPTLLVEIEQRHLSISIQKVFDKITSYGYKAFYYSHNKLLDLNEFSCDKHQKIYAIQEKTCHDYVNNFIFKPN